MAKIKVGVIGCGKQAAKHIASLKNIPNVEMVLSDIEIDLARDLAAKNRESWAESPDDIIADEKVQAVVICTPTHTHTSLIVRAIKAEKNVFCEKPLCDSMKEALELQRIEKQSDRIIMIGYIYRFVPIFEEGYRLFREQQQEGESLVLGRPLSAFFRLGGRGGHQLWKHQKVTGGGVINEMLVHMIDLANWYFGPLQKTEVISCDLRYPERIINGEKFQVDAEDFILIRFFGANGLEIFCQADLTTPAFSQYVEIQGENGSFMGSIKPDMPSYVYLKESRGGYISGKTELQYGRRNVLDMQMMTFIQAVLKRDFPNRNTVKDSLKLISIMDEIKKQVEV
jgi:predicted dehydrogenase